MLSVAVYNHYKRLAWQGDGKGEASETATRLHKSNIMLIGPTGCGKTLLAQTLAELLDVPFAVADATTLTEAGYVGKTWRTSCCGCCRRQIWMWIKPSGASFISTRSTRSLARARTLNHPRRIGRRGAAGAAQAAGRHRGQRAATGGRKHPYQDCIQIDTSQILFICGGAFVGLEDVVQRRMGRNAIGFIPEGGRSRNRQGKDQQAAHVLRHLEPDDLVKYGLIPEFIGRLPVSAVLEPLDTRALEAILTEPRDALVKQFQTLLSMDEVRLDFEPGAVEAIAAEAHRRKTGARALRGIVEELMLDLMYDLPSDKSTKTFTVTRELVEERTKAKVLPLPGSDQVQQETA